MSKRKQAKRRKRAKQRAKSLQKKRIRRSQHKNEVRRKYRQSALFAALSMAAMSERKLHDTMRGGDA